MQVELQHGFLHSHHAALDFLAFEPFYFANNAKTLAPAK